MNALVVRIVEGVPTDVFSDTTVKQLMSGSDARRYGLVKRAIQSGDIVHLKRGWYALSKRLRRKPVNLYAIAQKIYGPSYVSFESALSHHGWIPEAVYTVTSACSKRSLEMNTPLGMFSYSHIPSNIFFAGVQRVVSEDDVLFMATPWRALIDYVYIHKKKWEGTKPLVDNLRIDEDKIKNADFRLLEELYISTKSKNVKRFISSIKKELL